jgi:hypothetical protein
MLLKTDKTQELKRLTSAKKQPKKGHGNIPTEASKNKKQKTTRPGRTKDKKQQEMAQKTREGACPTVTRTKRSYPQGGCDILTQFYYTRWLD